MFNDFLQSILIDQNGNATNVNLFRILICLLKGIIIMA